MVLLPSACRLVLSIKVSTCLTFYHPNESQCVHFTDISFKILKTITIRSSKRKCSKPSQIPISLERKLSQMFIAHQ
uniref:Uncharacterized protein n=1 Tax=Nelumbo nucifera TaxID=4432 RepID=A0A822YK44_NELNU|nr:TPA_asm: hypothetical protein HUJ06_011811 [Nelumbo nucifera]